MGFLRYSLQYGSILFKISNELNPCCNIKMNKFTQSNTRTTFADALRSQTKQKKLMFKALSFVTLLPFITVSPENSISPLFSKIRYVKLLLYLLLAFFHLLFSSLFFVFSLFLFGIRIAFRCAAAAATTTAMATRTFGA